MCESLQLPEISSGVETFIHFCSNLKSRQTRGLVSHLIKTIEYTLEHRFVTDTRVVKRMGTGRLGWILNPVYRTPDEHRVLRESLRRNSERCVATRDRGSPTTSCTKDSTGVSV